MIVDLMRNDLGRVCEYGTVTAAEPRIEPHAGVWHMVSTVSGELREDVQDSALLRATFPPGSVTGAPKVQAMKVISKLEQTKRETYTGTIGIASPVAGSRAQRRNPHLRVCPAAEPGSGVGGGIVADSEPQAELEEALTKAAGPIAALGARLERPAHVHLPGLSQVANALDYGSRPDPRAAGCSQRCW